MPCPETGTCRVLRLPLGLLRALFFFGLFGKNFRTHFLSHMKAILKIEHTTRINAMGSSSWCWFHEHLRLLNFEHFEDPPRSFLSTGSFWTTKSLVLSRYEVRVQHPHPSNLHPPCFTWIHTFEFHLKILYISSLGSTNLLIQDGIFL